MSENESNLNLDETQPQPEAEPIEQEEASPDNVVDMPKSSPGTGRNALQEAQTAVAGPARERQGKIARIAALVGEDDWIRVFAQCSYTIRAQIASLFKPLGFGPQKLDERVKAVCPPAIDESAASGPTQYFGSGGQIWVDGSAGVTVLAQFNARILEEIEEDDGTDLEKQYKFRIAGWIGENDATDLGVIDVPAEDFGAMDWPTTKWGARAIIHSGRGVRDALRETIQILSASELKRRKVYTHVGWRKVDGRWVFLTPQGAIGAEGVPVEVDFDKRFSLGANGDMGEAIRASLALLDVGAHDVTYPLVTGGYASVLSAALKIRHSVWVKGATGEFKTAFCTLVQSHFGNFSSESDVVEGDMVSWGSSRPAIEMMLHKWKDVLSLLDNYVPKPGTSHQELEKKAFDVIQAVGDGAGRNLMNSDGTERKTKKPRGLCIMTGEDSPPSNASTIGRLVVVFVKKGSIDIEKLTAAQAKTALLPVAMRGFIEWLAKGGDERVAWLREQRTEIRARLTKGAGDDSHRRAASNLAVHITALTAFLRFAVESGAITEHEAGKLTLTADAAFRQVSQMSGQHAESSPTDRYLDALRSLIQTGSVKLASAEKSLAEVSEGAARGIGWTAEGEVCLDPGLSWDAVRRFYGDAKWPYQERHIYLTLQDQDHLAKPTGADQKAGRPTVRRTVGGSQKRVLALPMELFAAHIPPESTLDDSEQGVMDRV